MTDEQHRIIQLALLAIQQVAASACPIHVQHQEPDEVTISIAVLAELEMAGKALLGILAE